MRPSSERRVCRDRRFYEEAAELVDNAMEEKRTSQHNSVVNTICDYINNHYDKEITLDDVALLVHMNASYVSRVIKKVTGQNFIEILLSTRIEHAKQLLRNPAVKTYQVAEQVGISDSKYFSQLFKKATGMTPTEYRNFNYKG